VQEIAVHLRFSRTSAADGTRLERIDWRVELSGDLTDEQRARLLEIAQRCPMHRTLAPAINISLS
jgi:putative redox protein